MFKLPENTLEGRDYRAETMGIDYDDALRQAVQNHVNNNGRTVHDIALSLRVDEAWLQRWLDGEEAGTVDLLSALCANTDMTPTDIFSYSHSYAGEGGDVTPFKELLVKRLANSWTEADLMHSLMIANMMMHVPVAREGINQGVKLAMKIAEQFGYDTSKVKAGLERIKDHTYQTGIGAGPSA